MVFQLVLGGFSYPITRTIRTQIGKKSLGFRNMQEKLEKNFVCGLWRKRKMSWNNDIMSDVPVSHLFFKRYPKIDELHKVIHPKFYKN